MSKYFKIFALLLSISACEEPIDIDFEQAPPVPVIEVLYTNVPARNYARISMSTSIDNTSGFPAISTAIINLKGSDGTNLSFLPYSGNDPDSVGYYLPDSEIGGSVGTNYTLNVEIDGEMFTASDPMLQVATIDSITSNINELVRQDPEVEGQYYEVKLYTREPQETRDYYQFKFYRNDSLTYASDTDIYFADDALLGENIGGIPFPIFYSEKDTSMIEIYSMSRQAYLFYSDLQSILASDGGLFSPPPTNPRTNIQGGALGLFQVSYISSDTLVIE